MLIWHLLVGLGTMAHKATSAVGSNSSESSKQKVSHSIPGEMKVISADAINAAVDELMSSDPSVVEKASFFLENNPVLHCAVLQHMTTRSFDELVLEVALRRAKREAAGPNLPEEAAKTSK